MHERGKMPLFAAHHGGSLSPLHNDIFSYSLPPFLPMFNTLRTRATVPKSLLLVGVKAREGKREPSAFSADLQEPLSLLQTVVSPECSIWHRGPSPTTGEQLSVMVLALHRRRTRTST